MTQSGNAFIERLIMKPKAQSVWGVRHAIWFFAMGVGGALYLTRFLFGIRLGAVAGLELADLLGMLLVGIGGLILISDLGRPGRFWRALRKPGSSWIALGAVSDFVFLFCEALVLLPDLQVGGARPLQGMPWAQGTVLGFILQLLSAIAAFIVIVYPGLVLANSPAIPFWNNLLVPLQFLSFAFASAGGVGFVVLLFTGAAPADLVQRLAAVGMVALACTLLFVAGHLLAAYMQRGTARLSALLLLGGPLRSACWLGLAVGLVLPTVLVGAALAQGSPGGLSWLALGGVLICAANLNFKLVVLKAGLYAPIF